jgi:hypothetical protein
MSDFFNSIKQGLTEVIQYSEGKYPKAIVHQLITTNTLVLYSDLFVVLNTTR